MTNATLKQLLANKTIIDFQTDDQDFEHGLRLVLMDQDTGELGLLAVEPAMLMEFSKDDEAVLWYSYEELHEPRDLPSPEHFYQLDTLGRDDKSNVPFLQGEQAGLF
jgi:hypothetical protein